MKGWILALSATILMIFNAAAQVSVRCEMEGCGPVLRLFVFDGAAFKEFQRAELKDNAYEFKLDKSAEPRFFYIGQVEAVTLPILLGSEPKVMVKGNCSNIQNANISGSVLNSQYNNLKFQMNTQRNKSMELSRQLQWSSGDQEKVNATVAELKRIDEQKLAMLDSLKKANPLFARILALNTYLSFQNYGTAYEDEVSYFANEYFKYADLSDPTYNTLPWVFESFKSYTMTLSGIGLPDESHRKYIDATLWKIPKASPAHKLALSGVLSVLRQRNHPNFIYFAESFINTFKGIDPAAAGDLQNELKRQRAFMVGGEAPDFVQADTAGNDVKLSSFRGKVLLVDFWASWCGPCRKENPNVVRMYEKYKSKGFEILGVSLDSNKDRWLDAIKADKLVWQHVSDLKGWSNAVAQAYSVSSIPHTILLDQNGKILARGLRGAALEQKLGELLDNK